jgi:hypothetical protein
VNFATDPAAQAFRAEVRVFLRDRLPPDLAARTLRGYHARKQDMIAWTRILHAHGWSAPHWPRQVRPERSCAPHGARRHRESRSWAAASRA